MTRTLTLRLRVRPGLANEDSRQTSLAGPASALETFVVDAVRKNREFAQSFGSPQPDGAIPVALPTILHVTRETTFHAP